MSFRVDLMKETVTWAEKLDEQGSKATIRLDDKSQQTGTVAGVFLAAALSFLKPDSFNGLGPHAQVASGVLLFVGVIVLIACAATCLSVTWLRISPIPIALSVMVDFTEDIVRHPEEDLDDDVKVNLYRDRLRVWQQVLNGRTELNQQKARLLKAAQTLLATGICIISSLLFVVIWAIVRSHK